MIYDAEMLQKDLDTLWNWEKKKHCKCILTQINILFLKSFMPRNMYSTNFISCRVQYYAFVRFWPNNMVLDHMIQDHMVLDH